MDVCSVCLNVSCVVQLKLSVYVSFFFFQAEDGIRDLVRSRGLGDVYKRQDFDKVTRVEQAVQIGIADVGSKSLVNPYRDILELSLIHI